MAQSKLKINHSKSEFLLIGAKSQREEFINLFLLVVLDNKTNSADSAMQLVVFFDSGLNFRQHISQVFSPVSENNTRKNNDLKADPCLDFIQREQFIYI